MFSVEIGNSFITSPFIAILTGDLQKSGNPPKLLLAGKMEQSYFIPLFNNISKIQVFFEVIENAGAL